ncbi:MAG: DUF937 domain-containing protein [Candidatus Eisenbacteria bacterium]|nr:DUF937 domain-containing protein [Candidatus Eisenbacteria bacterium]
MGMFDSLLDKFDDLKDEAGEKSRALLGSTLEMLHEKGDGLKDLVDHFDAKGLGDKAKSWVGKGANLAVTPDEIKEALGPEKLQYLALKSKLSVEEVTSKLASHLPGLIDKITPDGEMPKVDLKEHLSGLLAKFRK